MKIVFKHKNITFIAFFLASVFCFLHLVITKDDIKHETKLRLENNTIELDFLGKDSVRYYNKLQVTEEVYKNIIE